MWKLKILTVAFCAVLCAEPSEPDLVSAEPLAKQTTEIPVATSAASQSGDSEKEESTPPKPHAFLDDEKESRAVHPMPEPPTSAEGEYRGTFVRTFLTLIGIILLFFLTIWLFRRAPMTRSKQLNNKKNIKVIESRQLSPKTMLYLVEVGGKQIVISESHIHVEKLTTIDWMPDAESE